MKKIILIILLIGTVSSAIAQNAPERYAHAFMLNREFDEVDVFSIGYEDQTIVFNSYQFINIFAVKRFIKSLGREKLEQIFNESKFVFVQFYGPGYKKHYTFDECLFLLTN